MKSFSKSTILGLVFGILLAFGVAVSTFQSPQLAPPQGNVLAPINVGSDPQVKSGGLWVGSLGVDGGVVVGGGISVGKTPTAPGDVITKKYLDDAFIAVGLADSDKDGVVDNLDCAPADNTKWQNLLVYTDSDGDGYGQSGTAANKCVGATTPSGFSANGTDCYDGNANARPGQTSYFSSNRGDGSFDYNCDGSISASDGVMPVTKKASAYSGGWSAYISNLSGQCTSHGTYFSSCGGCSGCTAVTLPVDCGTISSATNRWVGSAPIWNTSEASDTGSVTCISPGPAQDVCAVNEPFVALQCK